MRFLLTASLIMVANSSAIAAPAEIISAANASFQHLAEVVVVDQIDGRCGADDSVNPFAAYCTTDDTIFISKEAMNKPVADYLLAHVFGHVVQVEHGVADVALDAIWAEPSREKELRGYVARQVDCIAGVLVMRSGRSKMDLRKLLSADPFEDAHWGRNPLRAGPLMGIGLAARAKWFDIGQRGDLSQCAAGDFSSDLLLRADQWP